MSGSDTATLRDDSSYEVFSEAYKDVYHFRPSLEWLRSLTDEMYKAECDKLAAAFEREASDEREAQDRAAAAFEAHIADIMKSNGVDRDTAIRWDMDAMGITKDDIIYHGRGLYADKHGLKPSYFDKVA